MRRMPVPFVLLLAGAVACSRHGSPPPEVRQPQSASVPAQAHPRPVVRLVTSMGTITLELDREHAPITVDNFLRYVKDGHYDGTIFHRVIDGFMIQGGGFTPDMKQKPTRPPIRNEAHNGLSNTRGTIAMARTNVVDSATSQFFINVVDNSAILDYKGPEQYGYAVFGRVIEGMEVVDAIKAVPTTTFGMHRDVPVTPVVIQSAVVVVE